MFYFSKKERLNCYMKEEMGRRRIENENETTA
jgi:hypothetical protein